MTRWLKRKTDTCINIGCGEKLPDNYIKKQEKHYKYRFCPKCNTRKCVAYVSWKCIGCGVTISDGMLGRYFCKVNCSGRLSLKREQERQRQYAIRIAKKHLLKRPT